MLTCKLDMQSVRTSTESTQTNTESVRTNMESVCTFAGKVGICTESAESVWSVRNTWGSVKYWDNVLLVGMVQGKVEYCKYRTMSL
jgi:hypothetical protein